MIRFFSPAEVSLLQAVWPIAFGEDTRIAYRLLGNAISVPRAVISLVCACKALQVPGTPSPQDAVAVALRHRMRKSNAVFVPAGANWVLCHRQQLSDVFAGVASWAAPGPPPDFAGSFVPWEIRSSEQECPISVAASADPAQVCGLLGLSEAVPALVTQTAADVTGQLLHRPAASRPWMRVAALGLVLTCRGPFVVDFHNPLVWSQMLRIFKLLGVGRGVDLAVFSLQGRRLMEFSDFLPCCIAIAEESEFQQTPRSLWPTSRELAVDVDDLDQVCVSVTSEAAAELWLAYPFHPLGWGTKVSGFPPRDEASAAFCSSLLPGCVQLPPSELRALRRLWYVVARLDAVSVEPTAEGATLVEVQVVSKKLWQGYLPDVFEVESLEDWWTQTSTMCDMPHRCRVFSGPFPLPEGLCVYGLDPGASVSSASRVPDS